MPLVSFPRAKGADRLVFVGARGVFRDAQGVQPSVGVAQRQLRATCATFARQLRDE